MRNQANDGERGYYGVELRIPPLRFRVLGWSDVIMGSIVLAGRARRKDVG